MLFAQIYFNVFYLYWGSDSTGAHYRSTDFSIQSKIPSTEKSGKLLISIDIRQLLSHRSTFLVCQIYL